MSALEQGEDGGKDRRLVAACDVDDQTSWIVTMWGSWRMERCRLDRSCAFFTCREKPQLSCWASSTSRFWRRQGSSIRASRYHVHSGIAGFPKPYKP